MWVFPLIATLVMLREMFKPWTPEHQFDYDWLFRALWLVPIQFVWMVYLGWLLVSALK